MRASSGRLQVSRWRLPPQRPPRDVKVRSRCRQHTADQGPGTSDQRAATSFDFHCTARAVAAAVRMPREEALPELRRRIRAVKAEGDEVQRTREGRRTGRPRKSVSAAAGPRRERCGTLPSSTTLRRRAQRWNQRMPDQTYRTAQRRLAPITMRRSRRSRSSDRGDHVGRNAQASEPHM
jgi:hypothetical protein